MIDQQTPAPGPVSNRDKLGYWSLGLGVVALPLAAIPPLAWVGWIPAALAVVFGIIALLRKQGGWAFSLAGLIVGAVAWLTAIIVTLATLYAIGAALPDPIPVPFPFDTNTASATPTPTPTSIPTPTPTETAVAAPEDNGHECVDPVGDGAQNDLTKVTLDLSGQYLTTTFDLSQPMPPTSTAMVGLMVSTKAKDDAHYEAHQMGAQTLDGEVIAFFDSSFDSLQQTNLDYSDLTIQGNQVVAKFPAATVEGLGEEWEWRAFATYDGSDTDACPGELLSFDSITFQD